MENKLAGWGYSAGGLLVASAINKHPDLFRAAVLKVGIMPYITSRLFFPSALCVDVILFPVLIFVFRIVVGSLLRYLQYSSLSRSAS